MSQLKADRGLELAAADRDRFILRQHLCDFVRRTRIVRCASTLWRKRLHAGLAFAGCWGSAHSRIIMTGLEFVAIGDA